MFHRINYKSRECLARTSCPKRQPKPILLSKGMSNYDKLQKSMNEPVKEYNEIKDLVELQNYSITKLNNIENTKSKKNIDMMPHKKGKSKK